MADQQLNERLAKALGGGYVHLCDNVYVWSIPGVGELRANQFSPATSVDDLRKWVLPELERRGLAESLMIKLAADDDRAVSMGAREPARNVGHYMFRLLVMSPAVLATAALQVLDDDNA